MERGDIFYENTWRGTIGSVPLCFGDMSDQVGLDGGVRAATFATSPHSAKCHEVEVY